jgi:general secretion pathway protein J
MIAIRKTQLNLSEAGFTLLEMLIAVTLVAVMAVGIWGVFRISIRSWSRGTEFIDTNQHHRSIADLIRKQMASTLGIFSPADVMRGIPSSLIFNGAQDNLRFISANSLHFQESPGLTLVSYEVTQDSNGGFSLVEKESRYLGQIPDQDIYAGQLKPTTVFDNLTSCLFEYFDQGGSDVPAQWVQEWDGPDLRRLPAAISITMTSREAAGNSLIRRMVVPIQAEAVDQRLNMINQFGNRLGVTR